MPDGLCLAAKFPIAIVDVNKYMFSGYCFYVISNERLRK